MRRVPFLILAGLSLLVLFGSTGAASQTAPAGTDKVVHLLLFAALAWTGRLAGVPVLFLGLALLGYAALSEVLQAHLPWAQRSSSWADLAADGLGIALGLVLAQPRRRAGPGAGPAP